jgi:hypothetical protein
MRSTRFAVSAGVLLLVSTSSGLGCRREHAEPAAASTSGPSDVDPRTNQVSDDQVSDEWFADVTTAVGLDFVHLNGASGEYHLPEIMPPGVGLFDYDNDGDLDVYLVQSGALAGGQPVRRASTTGDGQVPLGGRLYRNDLTRSPNGSPQLRFTDVTAESRIQATGFGMGVAAGDIDNDGWIDLYLSNYGPNQLLRNNKDGSFTDVSRRSGTADEGFSVSASFVDYDRDGWLDLYVANYVVYRVGAETKCRAVAGGFDYCPPQAFRAQPSRLYRNNRDGTFGDVTKAAGMAGEVGPALGVATADFDNDGWADIYVAIDGAENQLWMNQRDGSFKNNALLAGAALSEVGRPEASMGVDAGDFDNDGDEDLFMTHLSEQGNNLYVNDGSGLFDDRSAAARLGPLSLAYTGFGAGWFDFDNDGWLDLATVNGTILANVQQGGRPKHQFPYDQKRQLFRNLRNGTFEEVTSHAGAAFQVPEVGRGAAFGDVDNDGDVDLLVGNLNGPTRLLLNTVGSRRHWVGLSLTGEKATLGARVTVVRADGSMLWRRARADGSYASANDPRVLVGLGDAAAAPRVRVRWPSGHTEEWRDVPVDTWTTIREGSGQRQ